jgi:hypothetical protein
VRPDESVRKYGTPLLAAAKEESRLQVPDGPRVTLPFRMNAGFKREAQKGRNENQAEDNK